MANSNVESKLVVTDLDFDTIKTNLKNFMRGQSTLTDYDFEGSALSNLIDLLAYNTHYLGFYANMIANEAFLDTASIRDSVVSHAKMLGYTPHSTKSSSGKINLSFTSASVATTATLPKFTKFSSSGLNGVNYTFTNLEEQTVQKIGGKFTFPNLMLTEGTPVTYTYTYNSATNPQTEFDIMDSNADTSTIEVIVQNSSTDLTQTTYILCTDATTIIDGNSLVYFIDETKNQKYKVYFGNGILGKKLTNGNIVIISYLLSSGSASNKANNFTLIDSLYTNGVADALINPTIQNIQAAAGGTEIESIEQIKFASTKSYISNNRAVTKNDYIALIQQKYPSLSAINVWGGEENIPPVYGKVYICAKPAYGYNLSLTEKQYIIDNIINPISMLTVTPEFVDPDYTYLRLNLKVTYNPTLTTKTLGEMETTIKSAVYSFAANNLDKFNTYFKVSQLMRYIDNSDPSILSSDVVVSLEKRFEPLIGINRNYTINFHTPLSRSYGAFKISSTKDSTFDAFDSNYVIRQCVFEEIPQYFTGIISATVVSGGSGLTVAPSLIVDGDGKGATLKPIIQNGRITGVRVTATGSGYSTAKIYAYDSNNILLPEIDIRPSLEVYAGKLGTYYFDSKSVKQTLSENAGRIDYNNGILTLSSFNPLDINDDLKNMKFIARPADSLFLSSKNSMLTLDIEDTSSIVLDLKQMR